MFSDLECDYINPIDLCQKLNAVRHLPNSFLVDEINPPPRTTVRAARNGRPCLLNTYFPAVWSMDVFYPQRPVGSV